MVERTEPEGVRFKYWVLDVTGVLDESCVLWFDHRSSTGAIRPEPSPGKRPVI